jgi:hypothetical protein
MAMQWGGINILMIYMVNVFRGSKSSIDPELGLYYLRLDLNRILGQKMEG